VGQGNRRIRERTDHPGGNALFEQEIQADQSIPDAVRTKALELASHWL